MDIIFVGQNNEPYEKILNKIDTSILLYTDKSKEIYKKMNKKFDKKIHSSHLFDGTSIFSTFKIIYNLCSTSKETIKINITGCSKISTLGVFIALGEINKKIDIEYLLEDEIYSFPQFSTNFKIDSILEKRTKKKLKILEILYEKKEIKNIEIARIVGNVKSAITYTMRELLDNNLVVKKGSKYEITKFGKDVYLILKFKEKIDN